MATLWGIPYLFIKLAVDDGVPPIFLAWSRIVLAAVVLLGLAWRAGTLGSVAGAWRWIAIFAVVEISLPFPLVAPCLYSPVPVIAIPCCAITNVI